MTDPTSEPTATVDEHGHPLYGLTVPIVDFPRYRLTPPPDGDSADRSDEAAR